MEEEVYTLSKARNDKNILRPALLNFRHSSSEFIIAFGRCIALTVFIEQVLHTLSYYFKRLEAVLRRIPNVEINHLLAFCLFALRLHHYVPYWAAYDIHSFCRLIRQLPFEVYHVIIP